MIDSLRKLSLIVFLSYYDQHYTSEAYSFPPSFNFAFKRFNRKRFPGTANSHLKKNAIKYTVPIQRDNFYLLSVDDDLSDVKTDLWRPEAESIIRSAAAEAGADESLVDISWRPGLVTIVVGGNTRMSTETEIKEDEELEEFDSDISGDSDLEESEDLEALNDLITADVENAPDITAIARSINAALEGDEGSVGWNVATFHEIEVTSPGAPEELSGVMFEVYKGFDVICDIIDKKTKKPKKLEGKLVERDDEITKINIKGRTKKLKNIEVLSIRLPKAKKEKGAR